MKVVAISNMDTALRAFYEARRQGYITFIYHHADPQHTLSQNKFSYVSSDEELMEKIDFIRQDLTVQEEILRW